MKTSYLQIESPYKTCPFKCPFCCSSFEGTYPFKEGNLLLENEALFKEHYKNIIIDYNITEVIITGMTEPALFPHWLDLILKVTQEIERELNITILKVLQTMSSIQIKGFDIVAYSVGTNERLLSLPSYEYGMTRYTVILNSQINRDNLKKVVTQKRNAQWTFKIMANTSNGHQEVDEWIQNNHLTLTQQEKDYYKELKVWIDDDCMNKSGQKQTLILRSCGDLYETWLSKNPLRTVQT